MHSTSSCSSVSRPRTKAALKGYENLKVSIPTTGIDLQLALDRSPNANGCKLAALADIALGTDIPSRLSRPTITASNEKINTLSPRIPKGTPSPRANVSPRTGLSPRISSVQHNDSFAIGKDIIKHNPLVLHKTSIDTAAVNKNIIDSIVNIQKKKKRTPQSTGNRLGFKEKKKKTKGNAKAASKSSAKDTVNAPAQQNDKPKDIYDFEESHDSVENEIIPLTHPRQQKTEQTVAEKSTTEPTDNILNGPVKKKDDTADEESSYSDRDDYYNFNSISGSGSEEDEPSEAESVMTKKRSKTPVDVQKKCLIMGRIFKNATKSSESESESEEIVKPLPKQKLDEIFDNLRSKDDKQESESTKANAHKADAATETNDGTTGLDTEENSSDDKLKRPEKSRKSREVVHLEAEWGMSVKKIKGLIGIGKRKTQRRCASNQQRKLVETWSSDEYEDFHSTRDVIALIQEAEVKAERAKAHSTKHPASTQEKPENMKNTSTEVISNDSNNSEPPKVDVRETESQVDESKSDKAKENSNKKQKNKANERKNIIDSDFEAKLEKPSESNKSKSKKTSRFSDILSEDSDFDEHWNKTARRAKIRNRRRAITPRDDLHTEESVKPKQPVKEKEFHFTPVEKETETVAKKEVIPSAGSKHREVKSSDTTSNALTKHKEIKSNDSKPHSATKQKEKSMSRRKRSATEMLYYWSSSSSDEDFGRIPNQDNDDDDNSEGHLEQHGWIVGDSHKKLVTLLAHAKGKNIDDCGVKETAHKKK